VAGTLPGAASYGNDIVYASATGGPTPFALAFTAPSSGGAVQSAGSQVLSFRTDAANTLRATTSAQ